MILNDASLESAVGQFFSYIRLKYEELMEDGVEAPRIPDPQISGSLITRGWDREHFETFMRRIREADRTAQRALAADTVEDAGSEWQRVFGELWPTEVQVKAAARAEAVCIQPGSAVVGATGLVVGIRHGVVAPKTRYHGA
ncbi:MAG TPA: hypothetical protein VMT87_05490 [Vicinamibacteria bacterium]|nr:hypothetical protein [Vicinamibacteria bacterium]